MQFILYLNVQYDNGVLQIISQKFTQHLVDVGHFQDRNNNRSFACNYVYKHSIIEKYRAIHILNNTFTAFVVTVGLKVRQIII